jgi:hypothetical protein
VGLRGCIESRNSNGENYLVMRILNISLTRFCHFCEYNSKTRCVIFCSLVAGGRVECCGKMPTEVVGKAVLK